MWHFGYQLHYCGQILSGRKFAKKLNSFEWAGVLHALRALRPCDPRNGAKWFDSGDNEKYKKNTHKISNWIFSLLFARLHHLSLQEERSNKILYRNIGTIENINRMLYQRYRNIQNFKYKTCTSGIPHHLILEEERSNKILYWRYRNIGTIENIKDI